MGTPPCSVGDVRRGHPPYHRWRARCVLEGLTLLLTIAALVLSLTALGMDDWVGVTLDEYNPHMEGEPTLKNEYMAWINTSAEGQPSPYMWVKRLPSIIPSRIGQFSECHNMVRELPLYYRPPAVSVNFGCDSKGENLKEEPDTFLCPLVALNSDPAARHPPQFNYETQLCPKDISQRCNGFKDCDSGLDEAGCPTPEFPPTTSDYTRCPNSLSLFIMKASLCNGFSNCGMDSDELQCCDKPNTVRCDDGSCVHGAMCDGRVHCFDLSDEMNCPLSSYDPYLSVQNHPDGVPGSAAAGPPASYWRCKSSQIIHSSAVCDNYFDCFDGSDETNATDCFPPEHPLSGTHAHSSPPPDSPLLASTSSASSPFKVSKEFDNETSCFRTTYDYEESEEVISSRDTVLGKTYGPNELSQAQHVFSTSYRLASVCLQLAGVFLGFVTLALLAAVAGVSWAGHAETTAMTAGSIAAAALTTSILSAGAYAVVVAGWARFCIAAVRLYNIVEGRGSEAHHGALEKAFHYMREPGFKWHASLQMLLVSVVLHTAVVACIAGMLCLRRKGKYGSMVESESEASERLTSLS